MADLAGNTGAQHSDNIGAMYIAYARRRLISEYLPKIRKCLSVLSEDDVWWRADESNNSVGNLLLHLSGNVRQWIVGGFSGVHEARDRPQEFSERSHIPKADLLKKLEDTLREADGTLEHFDHRKLHEQTVIQGFDVSYLDALSHVVEHFAQHLGQIILITKLRVPKDLQFYNL